MGALGFIAGGLLGGVGQGIQIDADNKRKEALAALAAERAEQSAVAADARAETRAIASDERKFKSQAGLLGLGSKLKAEVELPAQTAKELTVEGVKHANDVSLEAIKHRYNLSEDQAKQATAFANDLAKMKVQITHWDTDAKTGRMYGVTDTGKVYSSDIVPTPKASSEDAPLTRRGASAAEPSPPPSTRDTPRPATTPPTKATTQSVQKPAKPQGEVVTSAEFARTLSDAAMDQKYRTGPDGKRLSSAALKAKVIADLRAQGITGPF